MKGCYYPQSSHEPQVSIPRSKSCPGPNKHLDLSLSPDIHSIPALCSIAAKHPCPVTIPSIFYPWPKHRSPLIHNVTFPHVVMRWPHFTFQLHAPWQLVVTHSRGLITLHHFPFIPYPSSITHSHFNIPDPCCIINPKSCDLSISNYYSSIDSLV